MMMFKAGPALKFLAAVLLFAAALHRPVPAAAQSSSVRLGAHQAGAYTMVERSDWSRYDNGKYTGHVYHEVRALIKPETINSPGAADSGAFLYRGNFFVLEETLRDLRASARPVDAIVPVSFKLFRDGNMVLDEDNGYPSLRGFPAFPQEAVSPGTRWTARGQKAADPRHTGKAVLVPFAAEYEYRGRELYQEIPVHRITARYALRYQGGGFDGDFSTLNGTHTADILIRADNGLPLFIRDNLDETYTWPDSSTLRFRGFTLIFSQGTVPINRETVIASLGNSLGIRGGTGPGPRTAGSGPVPSGSSTSSPTGPSPANPAVSPSPPPARPQTRPPAGPQVRPPEEPPVRPAAPRPEPPPDNKAVTAEIPAPEKSLELVSVPEGVRLIVRDIRFVPDSDEFLREEWPRLDAITQALRQAAPNQTFLVEGHTASVGRPAGEMELSVRRAKRMVEELARRGIAEDRFIYKGWGGTRPAGDNSTEQGRSLNRRVEITILD